jgi:hypothetical protein
VAKGDKLPEGSGGVSDAIDRELAAAALRKRQAGQQPNTQELRALRRIEREREERDRWRYYRSIPQKHWREMSGRQARTINEQAIRYGLPFGGRHVDLTELVPALHEFLAANARKLAGEEGSDPLMSGVASPALERYREERAKLARLDRLERERSLLPRESIHDGLTQIASILRAAGETLQRQFGPDALDVLHGALDDAQKTIDALCFDADPDQSRPTSAE